MAETAGPHPLFRRPLCFRPFLLSGFQERDVFHATFKRAAVVSRHRPALRAAANPATPLVDVLAGRVTDPFVYGPALGPSILDVRAVVCERFFEGHTRGRPSPTLRSELRTTRESSPLHRLS